MIALGACSNKTETTTEKTNNNKTVVEKTKDVVTAPVVVVTDAFITTHVHEQFLGEDLLKDSDIDVDCKDHVVTLKGTVTTAAGRDRAVFLARNTDGVNDVVVQLTVKAKGY